MKKVLIVLAVIFMMISCPAQVTINDLTEATTVNTTDLGVMWQGGVTKKLSFANWNTWFNATTRTIGGTWTFSNTITGAISGNAGTVTNGVYTTGSYSDPSWLTSLALSKISAGSSGQIIVGNISGVPTYVSMSGDATISNAGVLTISANAVGSSEITNSTITNDDISSSAGIAISKLATSTAGNIIVFNGSGVPTSTTMGGDATINSSGSVTISSNAIGTAEVTNGTLLNEDISASASIDVTKLEAGTFGQVLVVNGSETNEWMTLSGDVTVSSSGVTDIAGTITDDVSWTGSHSYPPESFTPTGTTTLSASGVKNMLCHLDANTATITDFTSATDGQIINVINSNSSSFILVIQHGDEIKLNNQTNRQLDPGEAIMLTYVSSQDLWYQVGQ